MKKGFVATLAVFILTWMPILAQNPRIDIKHLDKLSSKVDQYIEISLSGQALRWGIKSMSKDDPELMEAMKDVKGIYVRMFSFEKKDTFSNEDIELIKRQIKIPPWEQVVRAIQKPDGDIGIYVLADSKKDTLKGLVVLMTQNNQLAFINIIGNFDPDKVDLLDGKFGAPKKEVKKKEE